MERGGMRLPVNSVPINSRSMDNLNYGQLNSSDYARYGAERSYENPMQPVPGSNLGGGEGYFQQNVYQPGHLRVPYPLAMGGAAQPMMTGKAVTPMSREMYRSPQNQTPVSMNNSMNALGSNAQGRAVNKMLLDILRERVIDPQRLNLAIETFVDRMDCVNLATLLFHTGKKRLPLSPLHIKQIADRFNLLNEELRAREASNALYGLKCLSSDVPEVRELVYALAKKIAVSPSEFVAQAVGNALYGLQMMSSEYEEVRYLVLVLSMKVGDCTELLEAQNVGNALYGLRGMNSDYKEVRALIAALTPKIANAREDLNGQALGNSLYGLQCMSSKEAEVRYLLSVLATKVTRTWEELKAQEVGNALYGLKRMSSDVPEVRMLIAALVPKIASSPELLDAQAVGNSFYGLQNMSTESTEVLSLVGVLADKVALSNPELDGQAMGNSLYGLQGMNSDYQEVRNAVSALTVKIQHSMLDMNAQELGNALYGMQNMSSNHSEVRRLLLAIAQKISNSKHELGSQEIGNALFGLQGMSSEHSETRILVTQLANKVRMSHSVLDPQGVSNSLYGLQRLASESAEVKALVQALAYKVEHCWKPLGAHHIAYACFGLQRMASDSAEVKFMIKTVASKIVATREEMSAKQLCYALYGLQSLSGDSAEVKSLLSALTEKISLSNDIWSGYNLSLALFGLQGFSSEVEEVNSLLEAIVLKASTSPLDFDPHALGNALYGFQRFKSTNGAVQKLLSILAAPFERVVSQPELVPPSAVANIFVGLASKSLSLDSVRAYLQGSFTCVHVFVERIKLFMQRTELNQDIFQELVRVFQCAVLCVHALQDTADHSDLLDRWRSFLVDVESLVEENSKLARSFPLSTGEANLLQDVVAALPKESSAVQTSILVGGFDVAVLVKFFANGSKEVDEAIVLEIVGSSYSYPSKELFYGLRNQFLESERRLTVISMSAELFAIAGQQGLIKQFNLMNTVLSSGLEDSAGLNRRVAALQKIVSFVQRGTPLFLAGSEYVDDEISLVQVGVHEQMKLKPFDGVRRPFGMSVGWIGMLPFFHSNPLASNAGSPVGSSATSSQFSPRVPQQQQQVGQQQQLPFQASPAVPKQPTPKAVLQASIQAPTQNPPISNIPGSRLSGAYQQSSSSSSIVTSQQSRPNSGEFNRPPSGEFGRPNSGEFSRASSEFTRPTSGEYNRPPSGDFGKLQRKDEDGDPYETAFSGSEQFTNFLGQSPAAMYSAFPTSTHAAQELHAGSYAQSVEDSAPSSSLSSSFLMPDIRINTEIPPTGSLAGNRNGMRFPSRSPMSAAAITPRPQMHVVSMTPIPESSSVDTVVHGEDGLLPENDKKLTSYDSDINLLKIATQQQQHQEPEDVEIMEAKLEIARLEKRIKELMQKKMMRKQSFKKELLAADSLDQAADVSPLIGMDGQLRLDDR